MKRLLLCCICLLASGWGFAQEYQLSVADVRQSSVRRQGTIEEATLSVRTKGLYMEYGLYLTFSARGATFYTNGDSLEVVLNFTLPAEAIVHDSWLWIGENIVKARMYDRWTAGTIYENIVNRRQDPSILVKNSATSYQLRVFPMVKTGTRKVKITWLQPINMYKNRAVADLPFSILNTSANPVQDFNLLVWTDDRFQAPQFVDQPDLPFELVDDPQAGTYYRVSLTPGWYAEDLHLQFASPFQDGVFASTFTNGGEQYYQLAVNPSYILPLPNHRKVTVLLDYQVAAGAPTSAKLLADTRSALLNTLSPNDSFNLFLSGLIIDPYANHWLPAHPDTIIQVFAGLGSQFTGYNNLQPLLVEGILWTQLNGGSDIVLVTNSNGISNLQTANPLLNQILILLDGAAPVHVVDYNHVNSPYISVNGYWYPGSAYFLSNLAALSGGVYYQTYDYTTSLKSALINCMSNLDQAAGVIEMYPQTQNGFCYGRFDVGNLNSNPNRPVGQVGKFTGEPPFTVSVNVLIGSQAFSNQIVVEADDFAPGDSLTEEMWYGNLVETLEAEPQTGPAISNVIYQSLSGWVLSRYTALLCLENTSWACDDCEDETQYVSTDDLAAADSLASAAPNPFVSRTVITIRTGSLHPEARKLDLFSADGRLVRQLDPVEQVGNIQYEWDGSDRAGSEAPAGIYLAFWQTGQRRGVLKLLKATP